MNCSKCGAPVTSDMMFCGECGAKVEIDMGLCCPKCGAPSKQGDGFCGECGYNFNQTRDRVVREMPVTSARGNKNNNLLLAIIAGAVIAVAIAVIIVAVIFIVKSTSEKSVGNVIPMDSSVSVSEPVKEDTITPLINNFISANASQGDISVAIIDCKTNAHYQSQHANSTYTAWGLYIPVYLAYGRYPGYNASVREGIVSSDAGTSNNNANIAMRDMGGLSSVNERLANDFGVRGTTYGRYFGESNANSDNYTTANDSVIFLQTLRNSNEYTNLSYNLGGFGITAPGSAVVYAHVGTENRNVRNDLNLFAVVKGQNSDYCVAILTRNRSGRYISQLLSEIHLEMERK